MKNKLIDVLKSSNFKVSLISIIMLCVSGLTTNSVVISEAEINNLKDTSFITITMFSLQVLSKIYISYSENGFNYDFLKSSNFISQILVILTLFLGAYFEEQTVSFIISSLTLISNMVFKISQPTKKKAKK